VAKAVVIVEMEQEDTAVATRGILEHERKEAANAAGSDGAGERERRGDGGGGRGSRRGAPFRRVSHARTVVVIDVARTQPRATDQSRILRPRAAEFVEAAQNVLPPIPAYHPSFGTGARLLFHETRRSRITSFGRSGILPKWRANELSTGPAFLRHSLPGPGSRQADP
jgi:hypothetical protein